MTYKLVCIDIDGTLLNSKSKITDTTKAAIKEAHNQGVHIVVSTGRMYTDAAYYSDLVGVKSPVIASNGAFIKEKDKGEIIYQSVLGEQLALEILEVFRSYRISPFFCTPHKFYYGSIFFKLFYFLAQLSGQRRNVLDTEYVPSWQRWRKVLRQERENIVKCEVIHRNIHSLGPFRERLQRINHLEIINSSKHNIELTAKGVSKGRAVQILADFYQVEREAVLAIGDSENDVSMLEYAGMGIAMGNAAAVVKQKADYVTDTNDRDGVAKALYKFVLTEQPADRQYEFS